MRVFGAPAASDNRGPGAGTGSDRVYFSPGQVAPVWAQLAASRPLSGSWRLRLTPLYKWYVRGSEPGGSSRQQRLAWRSPCGPHPLWLTPPAGLYQYPSPGKVEPKRLGSSPNLERAAEPRCLSSIPSLGRRGLG